MKKYAVCGVSSRGIKMFIEPIVNTYGNSCKIVGLLDTDPLRFDICYQRCPQLRGVPEYTPDEFDRMIAETSPDAIIVASPDFTHASYILQGLDKGLDVISEKPMVTTAEDCRKILEKEKTSRGKVTVSLNYRYSPSNRKIREMIIDGKVGRITSVDLNWFLDTYHGASYFKRWNRLRANSGGLSIHKCTHHFDLVQWWIDQLPVEAFSYGALNYYGPDGEFNPLKEDGRHCGTCLQKQGCTYYMRWSTRSMEVGADQGKQERRDVGGYSDYRPDACIFDSEIDIEDTYTATVKYDKGALLSYSVNFSLPYEGFRLAINGTKGRIETEKLNFRNSLDTTLQTIHYYPLFGAKESIHVVQDKGGHDGADPVIQEDLFLGPDPRRTYEILSGAKSGAYSVATGEAIWRSVKEQRPIKIDLS